jgi:hypothetical protein
MALTIVKRLIVVKKETDKKEAVSVDIVEDTVVARNAALLSLGFENTTGQDPDLSKKVFIDAIKTAHPTLKSIRIDDCIKDTDTGKYYYTFEIDDRRYAVDNFWISPETKKKDTKTRKDETDAS